MFVCVCVIKGWFQGKPRATEATVWVPHFDTPMASRSFSFQWPSLLAMFFPERGAGCDDVQSLGGIFLISSGRIFIVGLRGDRFHCWTDVFLGTRNANGCPFSRVPSFYGFNATPRGTPRSCEVRVLLRDEPRKWNGRGSRFSRGRLLSLRRTADSHNLGSKIWPPSCFGSGCSGPQTQCEAPGSVRCSRWAGGPRGV